MEQREQALLEQRRFVRSKASRMFITNLTNIPNFHITVAIRIFADDRDIVDVQFKQWLESIFSYGVIDTANKSLSEISDDLYEIVAGKYPSRDIDITILQDSNIGITINYNF